MKNLILAGTMVLGLATTAMAKEATGADAVAVDNACSQEAQTAGCGSEKVGTGLLKCLHAYKKEHKKDFKFSDGCKSAMKTMRHDRKERKEKKG